MFLIGSMNAVYGTFRIRLLIRVAENSERQKILGIATSGTEAIQIIAPALGAAILAFGLSARSLMLADGFSFILSAAILSLVHSCNSEQETTVAVKKATTLDGYLLLWRSLNLRRITFSEGVRSTAEALFLPVLIVLVNEHHSLEASQLGWVQSSISVGGFAMAFIFIRLKGSFKGLAAQGLGLLVLGVTKSLFLWHSNLFVLLILGCTVGVSMSFRQLSAELALMESLDDANSAVLISVYNSLISTMYIIGYAVSACLNSYWVATALASALCIAGGLYYFLPKKVEHGGAEAVPTA